MAAKSFVGSGGDVTVSGPLFDGRAAAAVERALEESRREIGEQGVNEVRSRLGSVLQNPTGRYQSGITTDLAREDITITDGGAVYGPWLEGTSSRNKSTRFKGYSTFRKVRDWLEGKAVDTVEDGVRRHIGEMGGS